MTGLDDRIRTHAEHALCAVESWPPDQLMGHLAGPAVFVASGATGPAARLWASLHARAGHPAWTMTPYELEHSALPDRTTVALISVSGGNHDIVRTAHLAGARRHPMCAFTATPDSPMATILRAAGQPIHLLPEPPDEHLLASPLRIVGLAVAAARVYGGPGRWGDVLVDGPCAAELPRRPRLLFGLGAGLAAPAAHDLCEKALESGYAPAVWTDLRNLAHGGLMAMAGDPSSAAVVLFCTAPQAEYTRRYAAALPSELATVVVQSAADGPHAALELIGAGIRLFESALQAAKMYPTHHAVPRWGREIHYLKVDPAD